MTSRIFASQINRAMDDNGTPVSGARAYFFEQGTTNPITVYYDQSLSVPHGSNSNLFVVADAQGVFPPMYFDEAVDLTVNITTAAGTSLTGYPIDLGRGLGNFGTSGDLISLTPTSAVPHNNVASAIGFLGSTLQEITNNPAALYDRQLITTTLVANTVTYTPSENTAAILFTAIGGGGSRIANPAIPPVGQIRIGSGGMAGSTVRHLTTNIANSYDITVGRYGRPSTYVGESTDIVGDNGYTLRAGGGGAGAVTNDTSLGDGAVIASYPTPSIGSIVPTGGELMLPPSQAGVSASGIGGVAYFTGQQPKSVPAVLISDDLGRFWGQGGYSSNLYDNYNTVNVSTPIVYLQGWHGVVLIEEFKILA